MGFHIIIQIKPPVVIPIFKHDEIRQTTKAKNRQFPAIFNKMEKQPSETSPDTKKIAKATRLNVLNKPNVSIQNNFLCEFNNIYYICILYKKTNYVN